MIRTQRLFIKKIEIKDAHSYVKIARKNDNLLVKYTPFLIADSERRAIEIIEDYSGPMSYMYGIWKNSNNTLVGVIIFDYYCNGDFVSVSYFIGKRYRGHGYIIETINSLLENFPENPYDTEINSFRFFVNFKNEASLRVQEKLNSKKIGSYSSHAFIFQKDIIKS